MNPIVPIGIAAALGTGLYLFEKKKLPGQKKAAGSSGFQTASFAQSTMSVSDVQKALNALGASPPLAVDGVAGEHTVAAIKSFQAQAGIAVDGVVGPQTVAALQHALGAHGAVAGLYDIEDLAEEAEREGSPSLVGGPWFMEDDGDTYAVGQDGDDPEYVGQSMMRLSGVNRRAASSRGYNVVGQRGHARPAPSQGLGARQGYDESSASGWCSPDVSQILADPSQMSQIGIQQLWAAKAEEAFGPGSAYRYSSPLTQQDLDSAQALATAELGGSSLGGVNLTSGEYDLEDEGEVFEVGQGCWSAPDINEALSDPEQLAEIAMHSMPYGYGLPYAVMPPQPQNQPIWGYPAGYGNMPVNAPIQPYGSYPAGYPYGPMNAPSMVVPSAPTIGGVQANPATVVPGQGYQFQSQAGRFF